MFIAVYEFEIEEGAEASFRKAWLEVTKAIYENSGSLGSRLHTSDKPGILVGYAQWPGREQWERDNEITDDLVQKARNDMQKYLVQSKTVYRLEVSDDFLQSTLAADHSQIV